MSRWWRHVTGSLRIRLLAAVALVVLVGLLIADVATYRALSSFLVERVDVQLNFAHRQLERALDRRERRGPVGLGDAAPGAWVRFVRADGTIVVNGSTRGEFETSQPQFPAGDLVGPDPGDTTYRTIDAPRGPEWRMRAERLPNGDVLAIALPLNEVRATLARLLAIELVVTLGVLALALGLGLWLVWLGLRPLARIEATASSIAGSDDLGARVEPDDPETEVGKLGHTLNTMFGRLQGAFAERDASEARLRQFVADASHELRTPVAAIGAYAELFERGADTRPDDLARSMKGIQRETKRIGTLVDDLMLLARLDEGRPLHHEPVELVALVGDAVETARAVGPQWPITVYAPELVTVTGDHVALRQIVDNFLANVRTHTPEGTPTTVSVVRQGDVAVIEVRDVGPGMSADDAAHVFERFYRADKSRTRASGGSGLGLAVVAALVEAHHGTAEVRSAPGEGTAFRVTLPATS